MARPINLDINNSGAWKRVASYDLDHIKDLDLMTAIDGLLGAAEEKKLSARLIAPGDTAPLVTWTMGKGWEEWGQP
jgi:hypothetical protein